MALNRCLINKIKQNIFDKTDELNFARFLFLTSKNIIYKVYKILQDKKLGKKYASIKYQLSQTISTTKDFNNKSYQTKQPTFCRK